MSGPARIKDPPPGGLAPVAQAPVSPTNIDITFSGLGRCAQNVSTVAAQGRDSQRAMDRSHVSPGSFGLMNAALGAAMTPMASQARGLAATLSQTAQRLAASTKELSSNWTGVENEAARITTRLAELLEDV